MRAPQEPPLRLLLVDDELPARRRLREVVEDCANALSLEITGEADSGLSALAEIQRSPPDAVLLDIKMPGMDGIEVAQHLQKLVHPPAVIFTTAYDHYACQAFEVNAVDYLMKPVRASRLATALSKARGLSRTVLDALREAHPKARTHLSLAEKGRLLLIPIADILYFKAELKYVTIKTPAREYLLEESLVKLETEFGAQFLRIHRNCLVARDKIAQISRAPLPEEGHLLRLTGLDEQLPVSRRQYSLIRELLQRQQLF